ncbi:MAG: HD domain-containing protein [Deltaproteobacteria bacterium]
MKCPGQDPRYWKFDAIFEVECPNCGHSVEFFKDETRRTCKKCGHRVLNPKMDFGCAAHCKFAEQCFGDLPPELLKRKEDLFKDRVAIKMKLYFKQDFKRIGHAAKVARYAEKLMNPEKGDPAVVLSAALLHDIGIKQAERKYQSTSAKYQHQEGPPVAREILTELDANNDLIDEVCDIIGHHHSPRKEETANFKVVYDADLIVNLQEKQKKNPIESEKLARIIETKFLTQSGKELARSVLLNGTA